MTDPTPQEQAKHLADTYARWADELTTIRLTKQPDELTKPQPIGDEPFDGEEDEG